MPGGEDIPRLIHRLLGTEPLTTIVPASVLAPVEAHLLSIRAAEPTVEWLRVNEQRVDVVVSTADDEWRSSASPRTASV